MPRKGQKMSEEAKQKIRESLLGRKRSEETKRRMSEGLKGKTGAKWTEERRKKFHDSTSGKKHHMYGKKHSEETRKKMSEAHKGRGHSEESKKLISEKAKEREISKETRAKISSTLKARFARLGPPNVGENNGMYGKRASKETREKMSRGQAKAILEGKKAGMPRYERGRFGSRKNRKWLYYRSSMELAFYERLEVYPGVISFVPEPFSIPYLFDGIQRLYIPDLDIRYVDGCRKLVEIKPRYRLKEPKEQAKLKAARIFAVENGFNSFEVWTEDILTLWQVA